ncbi:MAG TPA: nuclear transport factor 2 family protein [Pyrinomonadaceae bacterium]|nr:nuclear transport factor 2 family protein [Pyrinomonadaceae bacterium]
MKKMLILLAALTVAAACAAPPTNQTTTANTNSAATPSTPMMTEADAVAKEKAIWDTIKNKNYEAFANMLAEDQVEVSGEAVWDKTAAVASIKEFEPIEFTLSEWKFLSIDKDAYIVNYTANVKGKYRGKEFPVESARASSAWVNRNGRWLAIYHQECPVRPPMPPAANKPAAAKASPSPAAAPATTTAGSDPIANEKMVWDLFKSKNYDAFATLLASDFMEVEPDKVYDKAGSVVGVAQFDASKAVLSDWKAVQLDDDASLVTYVAKVPLPGAPAMGERHTSIWANRDGRWLAVFHHGGTPVTKPGAMATPGASASPAVKASPSPRTSPALSPNP